MNITVNGEPRCLDERSNIRDLLKTLGVNTPLVAVERNRILIPKSRHPETFLEDGDVLEVVTLVGGG